MRVSRFLVAVAVAAGFGGPVWAQSGGVSQAAADSVQAGARTEAGADARPLLWVTKDADSRVYLLGSFHALPPGTDVLPGPAAEAFADAEAVAFEVDMETAGAEASAALMEIVALSSSEGRVPLSEQLGPEDTARLDRALGRLGGTAESFDALDPWVTALLLSPMQMEAAGLDPVYGVEMQVSARAAAKGKAQLALETVAAQFEAMAGLPVEDQIAMLRSSLDEIAAGDGGMLPDLVEAWRTGDTDAIAALATEGETPVLYERLLANRNAAWAPQIEAFLNRTAAGGAPEDVLVVVGAAHLVGLDSVVEMLRARGYDVVRL